MKILRDNKIRSFITAGNVSEVYGLCSTTRIITLNRGLYPTQWKQNSAQSAIRRNPFLSSMLNVGIGMAS